MWDVRYRPSTFADVLGQQGSVSLLKARLAKGTALETNYVFSGGHGQGKTTLARILARAMLCLELNKSNPEPCNQCDNCQDQIKGTSNAFVEKDAASGGTIENIRAIVDDLPYAVFNASKRIYLFDEAHRMSPASQDVLLKPLEEKKMVGIFCTTEPEKIRGPIRSRCEDYAIRKVTREDVLVRMKRILDAEGVAHEDDGVLTVIDYSGGHVRDVLNRLEMIAQMGEVTLANVREHLKLSVVGTFYEILLALGDSKRAIELVDQACDRVPADEVAAGLAEAAMNSYRLANNMFADFVYVDRALGQQVYARFGVHTIRLAETFLQSKALSKVSLLCTVLNWAEGAPASNPGTTTFVQIPAPVFVQPVAVEAPPGEAPVTAAPAVAPAPPAPKAAPPPPQGPREVTPKAKDLRADGVGPRGSGDIAAQTDLDHKAVPRDKPRGRESAPHPVVFHGEQEGDQALTSEQWRIEFERTWPGRG